MALLAYLTAMVWKCNEAIRREVALKEGRSRRMCWVLGFVALAHGAAALLLYQQDLWKHLALMPAGGHDVRAVAAHAHGLLAASCLETARHCCSRPAAWTEAASVLVLTSVT